ncbi:MAG: RNA-binding domain-containing protein [Candidatus Kariarchaeaceae archaeon]|jgi:RNA binding exosome subunit
MVQFKKISLSGIAYITEEEERVHQALLNCLPEDLRVTKIKKQRLQSQFGDKLVLLTSELHNKEAKQVIEYIVSMWDIKEKQYFGRKLDTRIDLEEKAIYLRLDKFKALEEKLEITDGSDVIKVEIKYNAYTKDQNTIETVTELLVKTGMVLMDD